MYRYKITILIIIATLFGLGGGIVGALLARSYIFENAFQIPFMGDINLSGGSLGEPRLVITGARNVVVEQNDKVKETLASVAKNIVGIHEKIEQSPAVATGTKSIKPEELYDLNDYAGQGFILTSDGWIVSSYAPAAVKNSAASAPAAERESLAARYVVINEAKDIFSADDIIYDRASGLAFWHIPAVDLPVRGLAYARDVNNGQQILATNRQGGGWLTTVLERGFFDGRQARSSDSYRISFLLEQETPAVFKDSFLFTLENNLAGIIDSEGQALPLDNFLPCINCLLQNLDIERSYLGVYYRDLNEYAFPGDAAIDFGALISPNEAGVAVEAGSPAALAGLEAGDIIYSVDNIELKDDNLSKILNNYLPGEEIALGVLSQGRRSEIKVVLGAKD